MKIRLIINDQMLSATMEDSIPAREFSATAPAHCSAMRRGCRSWKSTHPFTGHTARRPMRVGLRWCLQAFAFR